MIEKILDDALGETPSMFRGRPYNGQPWTDSGKRGSQMVSGLTMRDIRDCFVRAYINGHLRTPKNAPYQDEADKGERACLSCNDMYDIEDAGGVDPMAIAQALTCEIEKIMGIFPNTPKFSFEETMAHVPTYDLDGKRVENETPK